jgi:hypothetical protein
VYPVVLMRVFSARGGRIRMERGMSDRSGMAVGFTIFAGVMMIMVGVFQALWGLAAIIKDQFFVVTPNYAYNVDVTTWGWIHLVVAAIIVLAGFGLFSGAVWARTVGVTLAVLSAIANFLTIPYYPLWSIMIIALDVFVIWALTAHGRDVISA